MAIGEIQSFQKVQAVKKLTKAAKQKIADEEALQARLRDKDIELKDYIDKYAAQNEIEIIEREDNDNDD